MRMRASIILALSLLAAGGIGCQQLKLERPRAVSEADWLTFGDSPYRTQYADITLDPPLEQAWEYDAGGGFGAVSPLLLRDVVLVANEKGEVHAIDLETGKKRGQENFGEAIHAAPVVGEGVLYIPLAWGRTVLRAFDLARGADRWRIRGVPIEGGLYLDDETLYAIDVESHLTAYEVAGGTPRWQRTLDSMATVFASPVRTARGHLVLADDAGMVYCLDPADGAEVWRRPLGAPVQTTPATDGETLFLATTRGRFFALDAATGTTRWHYAAPDTSVYLASPALGGKTVYFGGSDGLLRALDARTGEVRWTHAFEDAVTAPPLVTRGTVYVGTMGKMLYGLDRTSGEARWQHPLKGRVKSAMAARDGMLIVLTEPHHVYLFHPPETDYAASSD